MPELSRFFGIMVDIDLIRIVDVDYIKDYTMDCNYSAPL